MKQRVKVIGITGGIASGKSTIAEMLKSLGASVIDADKICHRLINTGSIIQKITERWGNQLQDENGRIERSRLGKIVFSSKRELTELNKIIHPYAIKKIITRINRLKDNTETKAIVLDAALLVESELTGICDIILFIDTQKHTCRTRAQGSRMWPSGEITRRERFQGSLHAKRKMADAVINNNISKTNTLKQVNDFWNQFITEKQNGG